MYNFLTGDSNNERVSYLKQKAEILTEIELFYLLPNQRRWKSWFPEVIYYYANVDRTREEIKRLISRDEWNADAFPEMKKDLFKKLVGDALEYYDDWLGFAEHMTGIMGGAIRSPVYGIRFELHFR
ncbi:unnamed protein product [Rhizophagus irregularis]|nr:unnamed protein product [Rhizophagus irregularis]